ncbi:hypothetical protein EZH22_10775 [Xanthobacter dioxanivorans]|uniref:Uncharacterized protein n=1 Tax=Xanthobacter dioxanivorans TaxID=2528964 RepID=A0A974PT05_9HYPH|nr:hypothetical protein [Xanthobacter dioxanivorans]QRG08718.1 hypothetical protein EZH22_10775 [Xanthobacter dioxanivorans]
MKKTFSGPSRSRWGRVNNLVSSYGQWVEDHIADGCTGYLFTFMFKSLSATTQAGKIDLMHGDIEKVYWRLAHRFAHHPDKPSQRRYLPLMLAAPDLPVFKTDKVSLADASLNDGLHEHAIVLAPMESRFRYELATWVKDNAFRLVPDTRLQRIHCVRLDTTPGKATEYALKAQGRRLPEDSLLILPKALSERGKATDRGYDEAVKSAQGCSLMRTWRKPF